MKKKFNFPINFPGKSNQLSASLISRTLIVLLAFVLIRCLPNQRTTDSPSLELPESIIVSPKVPADIFTGKPASEANLTSAAIFSWNQFIALNWQAKTGKRDVADTTKKFGDNPVGTPLVWHTFRHKVEIYPGNNKPPHGYSPDSADYGYNGKHFAPKYLYSPKHTRTPDGSVLPYDSTASTTTPWINLDETSQIGVDNMFAGVKDSTDNNNLILFLAKANKQEYVYAAKNKWYNGQNGLTAAQAKTKKYISTYGNTPAPGSSDMVSFPNGTIEIKTAWRKLTTAELASNAFYTNQVRYYVEKDDTIRYKDEVLGMVALHIIHKTPTAPYFIFSTFEQKDNILTTSGDPVEDAAGNIIGNKNMSPMTPNIKAMNAEGANPQSFSPTTANAVPGKSLYYKNIVAVNNSGSPLPDSLQLPLGIVRYNKRINPIPKDIIDANTKAHKTMRAYFKANMTDSIWLNYKLINVQYKPIDKPTPGMDYKKPDSATYYLSNSVVESDYILQKFSGRFYTTGDLAPNSITDFQDTTGYPTAHNSYYEGKKYLMGGCMGCHGNATNSGSDYSFIFGSPVTAPEPARETTSGEALFKRLRLFDKK